jgi:hypothetical protein
MNFKNRSSLTSNEKQNSVKWPAARTIRQIQAKMDDECGKNAETITVNCKLLITNLIKLSR